MRIALGIEYDGSAFKGWQVQRHDVSTVQAAVEAALTRVAAHPVRWSVPDARIPVRACGGPGGALRHRGATRSA